MYLIDPSLFPKGHQMNRIEKRKTMDRFGIQQAQLTSIFHLLFLSFFSAIATRIRQRAVKGAYEYHFSRIVPRTSFT